MSMQAVLLSLRDHFIFPIRNGNDSVDTMLTYVLECEYSGTLNRNKLPSAGDRDPTVRISAAAIDISFELAQWLISTARS